MRASVKRERTALYRHYDAEGVLLYVGIAVSVVGRLAQHAKGSHWSSRIAQITVEWFDSREQAEDAERAAIVDEAPMYNKAGVPLIGGRKVATAQIDAMILERSRMLRGPYKRLAYKLDDYRTNDYGISWHHRLFLGLPDLLFPVYVCEREYEALKSLRSQVTGRELTEAAALGMFADVWGARRRRAERGRARLLRWRAAAITSATSWSDA